MAIAVLDLLQEVNAAGQTILVVTHDDGIAACARRLVRMADGHIVADGTTAVAAAPTRRAPGTRTVTQGRVGHESRRPRRRPQRRRAAKPPPRPAK